MTPITSSETLYETALKYIGASPDGKSIESRKCRLLGNIGPDGEGFGPAFRTAVGLDADSSTPEFSRTVQAWAMWGQFVETKNGRQGDTVVTEDFVGIVDSIGEHEIRAIGFQNGAVRIAKVSRPKSMIRRAFSSEVKETATTEIIKATPDKEITHQEVVDVIAQMPSEIVDETPAMIVESVDTATVTPLAPAPERKKPGRKPKLATA